MNPVPKPIAVTCGDPAGIGPEILERILQEGVDLPVRVFGPKAWLQTLPVEGVAVGDPDFHANPSQPTEAGARIALLAMEAAAAACADGSCRAAVTGPVSKKALADIGFPFPGQTEFFAERWGGDPVMGFVGPSLRVVLATWHCPLRQVPELLERQPALLVRAVEAADRLARAGGSNAPRIAVCGLNPHAGEDGLLGEEEIRFLSIQLASLRPRFPGMVGPLPGDTVFWRLRQGEFDAAVALYHDQGLAPLKTLEFDQAVNVTLGLPWIRTSPDHGTAFDRAGKGTADPASFRRALDLAATLSSGLSLES